MDGKVAIENSDIVPLPSLSLCLCSLTLIYSVSFVLLLAIGQHSSHTFNQLDVSKGIQTTGQGLDCVIPFTC